MCGKNLALTGIKNPVPINSNLFVCLKEILKKRVDGKESKPTMPTYPEDRKRISSRDAPSSPPPLPPTLLTSNARFPKKAE